MKYSNLRFISALLVFILISFSPLSGQTWVKVNEPADNSFGFDVAVLPNGALAVDDMAGVWVSTNNGITWMLTLNTYNVLRMQATDRLYALGGLSGAFIYASNGDGTSWSNLASSSITTPYVTCIGVKSNDELYALGSLFGGSGCTIYKTTNQGLTWTSISSSEAPYLQEIIPGSGNMLYGVRVYGSEASRGFYRSTDGGASWSMSNNGIVDPSYSALSTTTSLSPLAMKGQDTLFLGTSGGKLYRSTDTGLSWQPMTTPFADVSTLASLIVTSASEIFVAAKTDTQFAVYRSSDNGGTWSAVAEPVSGVSFWSMAVTPRNTVVVLGDYDLYTNDTTLSINGNPRSFALHQNVPDPFDISTTIAYDLPRDVNVYLCVEDSSGDSVLTLVQGYFTAGTHQVQFAPDTSIHPGPYFCKMIADTFVDSIEMHYVKKTFALHQNVPDPFDVSTTIMYDLPKDANVYLCVEDSSGDSVLTLVQGYFMAGSHQVQFTPDASIHPGRYFCKMIADTFVDSIEMHYRTNVESGVDAPLAGGPNFVLSQNYPNPFNPSTVIRYRLPADGYVSLKVYDVLGQEVRMVVNERQIAGSHSVTLNATGLPTGVYFYRLEQGGYHDTRRLLLLK